jgi:uncharacterized membrane protein
LIELWASEAYLASKRVSVADDKLIIVLKEVVLDSLNETVIVIPSPLTSTDFAIDGDEVVVVDRW